MRVLHYITLIAIFNLCSARNSKESKEECSINLTSIALKNSKCENEPCFIFKYHKPFVRVQSYPREAFPCNSRKSVDGPFFELASAAFDNSYCIFIEDSCSSDALPELLKNAYMNNTKHKFIIGGVMFAIPERTSKYSMVSAPLFSEKMIVIGRKQDPSLRNVVHGMIQPFDNRTWFVVVSILLCFITIRLCIIWVFADPRSLSSWWWAIWGDFENLEILSSEDEAGLKFWSGWWIFIFQMLVAIILIFYEAAFANFVFQNNVPEIDLKSVLNETGVVQCSALEHFLAIETDYHGKYSCSGNIHRPPWIRYKNDHELFDNFTSNAPNGVNYAITYERFFSHELYSTVSCSKFAAYHILQHATRFSAVWFYGKGVDSALRIKIDRKIMTLSESGHINRIMKDGNEDYGSRNCEKQGEAISYGFLVVTLGVPFIAFILPMFVVLMRRIPERLKQRSNPSEIQALLQDRRVPLYGRTAHNSIAFENTTLPLFGPIYAPILRSADPDRIFRFLRERERYENEISSKQAELPTLVPLSYRESVDKSLLRTLIFLGRFDEAAPRTTDIQDLSDEEIKAALSSLVINHSSTGYTVSEIDQVLSGLKMPMHIRNPEGRVATFCTNFIERISCIEDKHLLSDEIKIVHLLKYLEPDKLKMKMKTLVESDDTLRKDLQTFLRRLLRELDNELL